MKSSWLPRASMVLAAFLLPAAASFLGVRSYQRVQRASPRSATSDSAGPATGTYLIAYVVLSSQCGACRDENTIRAIEGLRSALQRSAGSSYARVSVVGVGVEGTVADGYSFIESLDAGFDEVSIGGIWLNEVLTRVVWRQALAQPTVPQVILFARPIDATGYPRDISVGADSLMFSIVGRDSVIAWVAHGAPIAPAARRAAFAARR